MPNIANVQRQDDRRIHRRTIACALAAGLLPWPILSHPQPAARTYRLAVLGISRPGSAENPPVWPPWDAFLQELSKRGYAEGRNLVLERSYADGDPQKLEALASQLALLKPDVIFTHAGPAGALAARKATTTIPIVFELAGDPVERGIVTSLSHPGGNITGNGFYPLRLGPKRVQLLAAAVGKPKRIGVLRYRGARSLPWSAGYEADLAVPARDVGAQLSIFDVATSSEIEPAFEQMSRDRVDALMIDTSEFTAANGNWQRIAELAARHRLPAIAPYTYYVAAGLLAAYSVDFVDIFRRAAESVVKIFEGAKPADLPVQVAARYEFVVNLKTAETLGLVLPASVLVQATEVIK
jgi:putative ABC transport system substrate-binding protein